jgi:phage shock protein PspC (stress-responsive transcriptional regulator)
MNTTATNPQASSHAETESEGHSRTQHQPLCRPAHDRMLAGVAAGVARYFGIDVTVVRIVIAVLAVVGGAGVPLYLACWLLIPEEGCEQSLAAELIHSLSARSH